MMHIAEVVDLPSSALLLATRQLRVLVADASDENASADFANRKRIDRTEAVSVLLDLAQQIDIDALQAAVINGTCEAFDLLTHAEDGSAYYEGVSTQPAHVAAGLVVPQPTTVGEVAAGVERDRAVVITGPSGVGKSAVLWTSAAAMPGVLWFRVNHLDDGDVPDVIRLAHAYRASPQTPVGFLIDAAGTQQFTGWARLREAAAAIPGVVLIASARREDIATMGDLSSCATIDVRLDEDAAESIFNGLVRRGVTKAPHWAEAFEASNGLTLEYTHLLTSGRRLAEVVGEQVHRRISERRHDELEVLSLVSVADRWTAALDTGQLAAACSVSDFEMRASMSRLVDEHLVVERAGVVTGVHRLRSVALTDAIHSQPPPTLDETVARVLDLVATQQLHRFIANLLRDQSGAASVVLTQGSTGHLNPARVTAYLHGLRLADTLEAAKSWRDIADRCGVAATTQPLLFQFVIAELEFADLFPAELRQAQTEMLQVAGPDWRRGLVQQIGARRLVDLLLSTNDVDAAARLLSTLDDLEAALSTECRDSLLEHRQLIDGLSEAAIPQLADCLAAARSCDKAIAEALVDELGGEAAMLERLRAENPWVIELDVRNIDDAPVGFARLLHVSDELQGDPRQQAIDFGRLLLRCLPSIESVDVQALLPGGLELQLGDFTHGVSRLQRRYDHSTLRVAFTQARTRAVLSLLGATDTERLATALPLLEELLNLILEVGSQIATGRATASNESWPDRITTLHEQARSLPPAIGGLQLADTALGEEATVPLTDSLSSLITGVTGNALGRLAEPTGYGALGEYLADSVIEGDLQKSKLEPWHLLGTAGHPESLNRLDGALRDLHAVVHELARTDSEAAAIGRSARSGSRATALHRAAETCRRVQRRRVQEHRAELERLAGSVGRVKVLSDAAGLPRLTSEVGIAVEVSSLLEWATVVQSLQSALEPAKLAGETLVLIPTRDGRPVPSMTIRWITTMWPSDNIGPWADFLPLPHASPLADAFTQAQLGLQTVSGLNGLPSAQQDDERVKAAASSATEQFASARAELVAVSEDPLTTELLNIVDALAAMVVEEAESDDSRLSVAEHIAHGLVNQGDDEVLSAIAGSRVLALEWDIDSDNAVALFQSLSEAS
jgi:hypothetical protein